MRYYRSPSWKMDYVTVIGFVAGSFSAVAFSPQVVKAWKSKSTKDVSPGAFALLCTGVFLWIIYGIYVNSLPIVASNAVIFALAFTILILKAKYK